MNRKFAASILPALLLAIPMTVHAQVNTTGAAPTPPANSAGTTILDSAGTNKLAVSGAGAANVSVDNAVDGTSGTCSSTGTGAQAICTLTASQLQGFDYLAISYSTSGSGQTATPYQNTTDAGATWNIAQASQDGGLFSTGQAIVTGHTQYVPIVGNGFRINILTLTGGTVTANYVLKRGAIPITTVVAVSANPALGSDGTAPLKVGCIYQTGTTAAGSTQKQNLGCDPYGSVQEAAYPANSTPVGAPSATTGNTANAATMAAVASVYNYVSALTCTAGGSTTLALGTVTVTGLQGGTKTFGFAFPTGATLLATPLVLTFRPPLRSSAVNTAVVATISAAGTGNTFEQCDLNGYTQ